MGCLFPEAQSPEAFFNLLMEKRDVTTLLSADELGVDPGFYIDPNPGTPDKIGYNKNGHIRNFRFDPNGYHLEPSYLESLDRIYQWSIYAAGEAIKDSGYRNNLSVSSTCGIIMGNLTFPTLASKRIFSRIHHLALEPYLQKLLHRNDLSLAEQLPENISDDNAWTVGQPGRTAARALGLNGPCYEVDAACASSIYVIQLAGFYLLGGQADMMLAGAVCAPDYLYVDQGLRMLQAFPPPHGKSLPFDRSSQGIKIGEGAGFLVLKRYSDAVRDHDHVHAVVESIGLSNDGRGKHILMPSSAGQILSLERAYKGLDRQVDYIECHATGTPLGDKTELATLEHFFGNAPFLPLLGGNKANIGHTLTVSAMAGIIKVIMGMKQDIIPAMIGIENPIHSPNNRFTGKHIIRDHSPWPQNSGRKIAGINAFGFGGVNSHMVLTGPPEEKSGIHSIPPANLSGKEKLAIVGMHGHWGNIDSLDELNDMIYHARQNFHPLKSERWIGGDRNRKLLETFGYQDGIAPHGSYCDAFDLDCIRLKIPPHEANENLFNHLLMLHVADRALQDTGFSITGKKRNIAVVIGTQMDWANHRRLTRLELPLHLQRMLRQYGIDLSADQVNLLESVTKDAVCAHPTLEGTTGGIGNLAACRISAVWNFTGPGFLVSSQENSAFKGLQIARFLLSFDDDIEAVVLGAVDLSGCLEHVLWHGRSHQTAIAGQGFAFDLASSGMNVGEGAGAIVLKREGDCREDRVYARIRALQILQHRSSHPAKTAPEPEFVSQACTDALKEAGVSPQQIGYLEAHAGGIGQEDRAELAGLCHVYHRRTEKSDMVIGSIKANIGHTFAASGMASMIKTALCLYHGYIPGIPGRRGPKYPDIMPANTFRMTGRSRPWSDSSRMAAINGIGSDGAYVHTILEGPAEKKQNNYRKKEPRTEAGNMRGRLIKKLSSGRQPIGTFILQEKNQKRFPYAIRQASAIRLDPHPIQKLIDNAIRRNAETQLTYSLVKQSFQKDLLAILTGEPPLVWDSDQILEMTEGRLSAVLGPEYRDIDHYPVRARIPLPPFQFVSRVTRLHAEPGRLKPCFMGWEYDIPRDAWYITNGMVPAIVPFESSHGLILALSYIGCDRLFEGNRRYRAVDTSVSISGSLPSPGDTIVGKVNIHTFLRTGGNLLIFYDFCCCVNSREIFQIKANAGFFSPRDLNRVRGSLSHEEELKEEAPDQITPLLHCSKKTFRDKEIDALQQGDFASCFGSEYRAQRPGMLCAPQLKMIDRVISIDRSGGRWGLGEVIGEKNITPDHWVFAAHFKNDPVLPGTMLVEGCSQLIIFYMFYLGLHTRFSCLHVDLVKGITTIAKFRGEIKPGFTRIRFHLQVQNIAVSPETFTVASVKVIHQGRVIGICDHFGVSFFERNI